MGIYLKLFTYVKPVCLNLQIREKNFTVQMPRLVGILLRMASDNTSMMANSKGLAAVFTLPVILARVPNKYIQKDRIYLYYATSAWKRNEGFPLFNIQ